MVAVEPSIGHVMCIFVVCVNQWLTQSRQQSGPRKVSSLSPPKIVLNFAAAGGMLTDSDRPLPLHRHRHR